MASMGTPRLSRVLDFTGMLARFVREADIDCIMVAGRWSLLDRSAGEELLPLCAERELGVLVAGVFNSGILACRGRTPPSTTSRRRQSCWIERAECKTLARRAESRCGQPRSSSRCATPQSARPSSVPARMQRSSKTSPTSTGKLRPSFGTSSTPAERRAMGAAARSTLGPNAEVRHPAVDEEPHARRRACRRGC